MDDETFKDQEVSDLKAALRGTEYKKLQAKNAVTDVPDGFKEWVAENEGKQAGWASTPYFIKDNFRGGQLAEGLKFDTNYIKNNVTFVDVSINDQNLDIRAENVRAAMAKYNAYDSDVWKKDYFDKVTGGYMVTDRRRIQHAQSSKNETEKFQKEYEQALVFAKNGHCIEFLKEGSRVSLPDVKFDGVLGDLKRTSSHNNIANYAKKAIREQNAEIVLFQFDNETEKIYIELLKLKNKYGIKTYYFFTGSNKVYTNFKNGTAG